MLPDDRIAWFVLGVAFIVCGFFVFFMVLSESQNDDTNVVPQSYPYSTEAVVLDVTINKSDIGKPGSEATARRLQELNFPDIKFSEYGVTVLARYSTQKQPNQEITAESIVRGTKAKLLYEQFQEVRQQVRQQEIKTERQKAFELLGQNTPAHQQIETPKTENAPNLVIMVRHAWPDVADFTVLSESEQSMQIKTKVQPVPESPVYKWFGLLFAFVVIVLGLLLISAQVKYWQTGKNV